jgi:2-haloacid dehalogenase
MPSNPVQAILFDFGGVLLDWNPRNLYRRFFDDPQQMEQFLAEIHFSEWNYEQDKGRPFADGVAELSKRFPQHARLIRLYHERWEETVSGPIPGSVDILRRLKRLGRRLYGLSNWSAETFPIARRKYGQLFDLLDGYVISGQVGLAKPDPAIFQYVADRLGCPASACLLIDDHEPNVESAQRLGFQTILFRSAEQLADELRQRGLLDSGDDRAR